jgi:hypothetical protein
MSHELHYDSDADCVILRVEGTVTMDLIREIAPQAARMCEETGCRRLLNDMRSTTINISFVELFGSPTAMDESGVSRTIKRALLVPAAFEESQFLENVTRNRGHDLMVFRDIEEAKRWLLTD